MREKELDRNGYAPSIFPTDSGRCFLCNNQTETIRHECFYGIANRKNSKRLGVWVNICPSCHKIVHLYPNVGLDAYLKRNAQWRFEQSHTRKEFMETFGRNWL